MRWTPRISKSATLFAMNQEITSNLGTTEKENQRREWNRPKREIDVHVISGQEHF